VAYGPAPRVEWAPDGTRLLVCIGGTIAIHAEGGALQRVAAPAGFLDARWRSDGTIVGLDSYGVLRSFTMHGALYTAEPPPPPRDAQTTFSAGALSGDGATCVVIDDINVHVRSGQRRWRFSEHDYGINSEPGRYSAALSADGKLLALGYQTRAATARWSIQSGRGWLVLDMVPPRRPASSYYYEPPAQVVDRGWYEVAVSDGALRFAFDGKARRLAIAAPERELGFGVVRVGVGEAKRAHAGGAVAVAVDERGILAGYAVAGRVRVDYLAPQLKGPAVVELLDTLWIDPDRAPVALALDRAGRRIACLAADGAVEIVPVP